MFFCPAGAGVLGDPLVCEGEFREVTKECGEGFFREIGEAAAVPFPFEGAVFERGVDDAAGFEGGDHAAEDIGEVRGGDVLMLFDRLMQEYFR